jgi:hypothetical protein
VDGFRERGSRRHDQEKEKAVDLLGRNFDEITIKPKDFGCLLKFPQRGSPVYRVDWMKPEEE